METTKDSDLDSMTADELKAEVIKLRAGIRQHRDANGHNLCWYVPELWNLLPDKIDPKPQVPPFDEFLDCCRSYRIGLGILTQEKLDEERERILSLDFEDPIDQ